MPRNWKNWKTGMRSQQMCLHEANYYTILYTAFIYQLQIHFDKNLDCYHQGQGRRLRWGWWLWLWSWLWLPQPGELHLRPVWPRPSPPVTRVQPQPPAHPQCDNHRLRPGLTGRVHGHGGWDPGQWQHRPHRQDWEAWVPSIRCDQPGFSQSSTQAFDGGLRNAGEKAHIKIIEDLHSLL